MTTTEAEGEGEATGRFCPLCERRTRAPTCEVDGVPTVPEALFGAEPEDSAVGQTLAGRFRIDSPLATGGMGRVFRATDLQSGDVVAIKLLKRDLADSRQAIRRFYREAHAVAQLDSEHIVRVLGFGFDETAGTPWLAMELVEGGTLATRLARGSLTPARALALARDIAQALVEAARAGIVHRDLKPTNIGLTPEGRAKVMDFGVARRLAEQGARVTKTGAPVGTPAYMAPEQISGGAVDPRSDLYALGCVLYAMLTGEPPFTGGDPVVVMNRHIAEHPAPLPKRLPSGEVTPPRLAALVSRLLAKQPADRPSGPEAVLAALGSPQLLLEGPAEAPPETERTWDGDAPAPLAHADSRRGSVTAQILPILLMVAASHGRRPPEICAHFGIPQQWLLDAEARVPVPMILRIWEELPRLCEAPNLGLEVGVALATSDFLLNTAVLASPDLRTAMRRSLAMERFINDLPGVPPSTIEVVGDQLRLSHHDPQLTRHIAEMTCSGWLAIVRRKVAGELSAVGVYFRHPRPESIDAHLAVFGCTPTFDANQTTLVLPAEVLDRPSREYSPLLDRMMSSYLSGLLDRTPEAEPPLLSQLRPLIMSRLADGAPSIGVVATALGLKVATLREELTAWGTTYQELVETLQRQTALKLLDEPLNSLQAIAWSTGFASLEQFTAAVRRWTGEHPDALRRRGRS